MATRIIVARRFFSSLNRFASYGGPCATDVWARCLQSSAQLNERKCFKKQFSTGLLYPDDIDLKSKLIEMEQKLETTVNKEDLEQFKDDVRKEMSSISQGLQQTVYDLKRLEEKLDRLNDGKSVLSNASEEEKDQISKHAVREMEAREYRRRCLKIHNVPKDEVSPFRRLESLNAILKDLGSNVQAVYVSRPLNGYVVVRFRNAEERDRVAYMSWKIPQTGDPLWQNTRFGPTFTAMQWLSVKNELTEKNDKAESVGLGRPWFVNAAGFIVRKRMSDTEF